LGEKATFHQSASGTAVRESIFECKSGYS